MMQESSDMRAQQQPPPDGAATARLRLGITMASLGLLAAGCATPGAAPADPDPWEDANRAVYRFNDTVDRALIKPVTLAYTTLTPKPARTCIRNMFNNLGDVWSAGNSFLQARPHDFFNTLGRVLFNSTMGLGGCIDVASMNGAPRIRNDFGITLGVWGLESGPYVVLPILGPSTLRDGTATVGAFAGGFSPTSPLFAIDRVRVRNPIVGLYALDLRAGLLDADALVEDVALDPYSFVRDAYLQRRQADVRRRRGDENALPDYGDDDLPDYSDDDDTAPPAQDTAVPGDRN